MKAPYLLLPWDMVSLILVENGVLGWYSLVGRVGSQGTYTGYEEVGRVQTFVGVLVVLLLRLILLVWRMYFL